MGVIDLEVIEKSSIVELEVVEKFNPYHDKYGRFTSASGAASFTVGAGGKGQQAAIANEKKKHEAEIKAVASSKIAEAVKAEPGITKNLTGIAAKNGATMVGLEYKLKTASSLERKVRTECQEKGMTPEQAIKKMYDVNRYTMQADESNFTATVKNTFSTLEGEGYKVERVKNTFQKGKEYVAVNCVLSDKNGTRFELQFHTKKSLEVKEVNHKLYEEQRADSTPAARRKELGQIMANNTNSIPIPAGIETVKSFSNL